MFQVRKFGVLLLPFCLHSPVLPINVRSLVPRSGHAVILPRISISQSNLTGALAVETLCNSLVLSHAKGVAWNHFKEFLSCFLLRQMPCINKILMNLAISSFLQSLLLHTCWSCTFLIARL